MPTGPGTSIREQFQTQIARFDAGNLTASDLQAWLLASSDAIVTTANEGDDILWEWTQRVQECLSRHGNGERDEDATRKCVRQSLWEWKFFRS